MKFSNLCNLAAEKTSVPGIPIATFAGEVKTVLILKFLSFSVVTGAIVLCLVLNAVASS